jgi:hypothetical protein
MARHWRAFYFGDFTAPSIPIIAVLEAARIPQAKPAVAKFKLRANS